MKISIIHPSRSRPEMAYKTARKWLLFAEKPDQIEYILSIDNDDQLSSNYNDLFLSKTQFKGTGLMCMGNVTVMSCDNNSAIQAINNAASICTGDLIIVVSDDFDTCAIWDTVLKDALKDKSDFLVKTDDGIQPTLITLPIMDRKYYDRFGYVYHPDYLHMFCDQEMTAVGHMLGKVIELPILFKHNHYMIGGMEKDAINVKNDATWNQGQRLFNHRLKTNFGLKQEDIFKPYSAIKWK